MPSPVGHALAGTAIALAVHPWLPRGRRPLRYALIAAIVLAVLPDADLVYQPIHRAVTHSLGSTFLIMIIAAAVTRWVTGTWTAAIVVLCGAAWGSHIALDWLGADPTPPRGIKALWPFSHEWFISDWDVFRGTERRRLFTAASVLYNLKAVAQEIAILAPVAAALAVWRWRALHLTSTARRNPVAVPHRR